MLRLLAALLVGLTVAATAHAVPLLGTKWGDPAFGTGATITYSIVPDGTFQSETSWGNVPGRNVGFERFAPADYRTVIRSAFDTWSRAADLRFVEVGDDGEPFGIAGSGEIRLWGGYTEDPYLAWTYFPLSTPESGDIFFNSRFGYAITDDDPFAYRFDWIIVHEIGHALGLLHEDFDVTSVMYPFYPVGQGQLNAGDIASIRRLYGLPVNVPEPAAVASMGVGLIGMAVIRRRGRRSGFRSVRFGKASECPTRYGSRPPDCIRGPADGA